MVLKTRDLFQSSSTPGSARLKRAFAPSDLNPPQQFIPPTMLSRIFRAIAYLAIVLACLLQLAAANVEKEIFLGPPASTDPDVSLAGHLVPQLASSEHCSNCRAIRTRLNTSFVGKGVEHWVRVNGLEEGRRYEVRICWAATVCTLCTSFWTLLTRVWPATDGFYAGSVYS